MKESVIKILKTLLKKRGIELKEKEINSLLEIPPSPDMGDFAFPCFTLSKKLKKSPKEIADDLRKEIKIIPKEFEDIQTAGPYLNFFVDRKILAKKLISEILKSKEKYGSSSIGKSKTTMIEFSQPNTHKAFHIGHIRGTVLGESLSRISEFCGEKIIRANYSGDTGMHIAKWIWNYKKNHSKEKLKNDEAWIASIYVDAVKRLAKNKKLQEQVDKINQELDLKKDKKLMQLWKSTRKLSIESWTKIYRELGTRFDVHFFESQMEKRGKEITQELVKRGIAEKSDNAIIINFEKYHLGILVFLRKDGTVLYAGKDLALAEKKFKNYNLDKSIYVVGAAQSLYLSQIFKALELMKSSFANKCIHVPFSEVRFPHGKMSSRTGENILYSDFREEMKNYAEKRIKNRSEKISPKELEKRSLIVSIAAIKYSMLKQGQTKNIIFRKEDALNFEGDTGPYLIYSYARANSILRKAKKYKKNKFSIKNLESKEIELVKKLYLFKEIVSNSYSNLNPAIIANYSYQLAQIFNEFYHACPVLNSEQESFRLNLVEAFQQVLKNSLNLLGIETLDKM